MIVENKILRHSGLAEIIKRLHDGGTQVYAPVKKDNVTDFRRISDLLSMDLDYIVTTQSAKFVLFPSVEELFEIETSKDRITLRDKDMDSIPEIVLLGTRPCDAAGMHRLNTMFSSDSKDSIYAACLEKLTMISISCNKSDSNCFCTSVNVSPGSTSGSDILLTQIENNDFLAEVITEKGRSLAEKYSEYFEEAPSIEKEKYLTHVPVKFDVAGLSDKIYSKFESDVWMEQSLKCIGCGTCAYVCPTCACFDIQDVYNGRKGQRKRSWDSCGFSLFTLHASGHNPRHVQSQRWRQRIMHKFVYMPEQYKMMGCTGCGRCSRSCPVNMNIKELVSDLKKSLQNG